LVPGLPGYQARPNLLVTDPLPELFPSSADATDDDLARTLVANGRVFFVERNGLMFAMYGREEGECTPLGTIKEIASNPDYYGIYLALNDPPAGYDFFPYQSASLSFNLMTKLERLPADGAVWIVVYRCDRSNL